MSNQQDIKIIDAWIKGEFKTLRRANIFMQDSVLYSYGHHFEIGRLVRHPVTGAERGLAILNGDRSSHTTTRHQADTRWALNTRAIASVIIPFEALSAAGIVTDTIRPIHVERDRFESTHHRADQPPAGMIDRDTGQRMLRHGDENSWIHTDDELYQQIVGVIEQTGDLRWRTQAVIKKDGMYEWHTERHWLGDCVFTAQVRRNGRTRDNVPFISSFDRQETRRLYFLSELPRYAVDIDDALEALKPESVATAEMMGRTISRQGDMFWIEMPGITKRQLRKMGAEFTKRTVEFNWSGHAIQQMQQRDQLQAIAKEIGPEPANNWDMQSRTSHRAWLEIITAKYNERFVDSTNPYLRIPGDWSTQRGLNYKPDTWERRRARDVTGESIYGTSHTMSEVAVLPDGTTFGRGSMYHEPSLIGENRAADHARRKMGDGKTWGVIVRNSVPLQDGRN